MAFHRVPFYIGGGPEGNPEHPADLVRQTMPLGGNGVEGATALQPRATNPVSNQVILAPGGVIMQGKAAEYQGPYSDFNSGDLTVTLPDNNTGAERYDMVVVRVEDPDFEGSRDRMVDELIFTETITGVPSTAKTLDEAGKPGYTAVPVLRARRSATSNDVADADITDLRKLAKPRTEFVQTSIQHDWTVLQTVVEADGIVPFPEGGETTVTVPEWATIMDVAIGLHGVRGDGQDSTDHSIYGAFYIEIAGTTYASSIYNKDWSTRYIEFSGGTAARFDCSAVQGQQVLVRSMGEVRSGPPELEALDTSTVIQTFFTEKPVTYSA